jgi:hypothetical protein
MPVQLEQRFRVAHRREIAVGHERPPAPAGMRSNPLSRSSRVAWMPGRAEVFM